MHFTEISDIRRFEVLPECEEEIIESMGRLYAISVLAVYDFRPGAALLLAPVGTSDGDTLVFVDEPKFFFRDQVRESMG